MHFQLTESFNSYRPNCVFSSSSPLVYFHLLVRSPLDESVPFRERRETKRKPLLEYCPQDFLLFRLWFRWCAVECTLWIGRQAPEQVLSETIFGKWIECKSVNEIESCILLGHASINIISGTSRFDRAPVRCHSSEKPAEKKLIYFMNAPESFSVSCARARRAHIDSVNGFGVYTTVVASTQALFICEI